MADLRRDDRGQILLVAAFALAVIFVAMALIVNSAIFTENLASRGETSGADGALSMRADVEANVGDAVSAANHNESVSNRTEAVRASVRNISVQTGKQAARSGRLVDVAFLANTSGERIYQSTNSEFTNGSGDDSYRVVGDVSRVDDANGTRAFEIEATDIAATDNSSAFEIRVQESGSVGNENSWRARIWNVSANDTVRVRTLKNDGTATVVEDCEVPHDTTRSTVSIDVTGGSINGEECDALGTGPSGENFHFGAGTGVAPGTTDAYDISFANAGNITGNFSMVVYERSSGVLDLSTIGTDTESSTALYGVRVRYTYFTAKLRYRTDIRVAPGEPDV